MLCFGGFWYFWLTIQNTANRLIRNLFYLLAVFISFPLARAAAERNHMLEGLDRIFRKTLTFGLKEGTQPSRLIYEY
jgi:hypothetical protein